ncbi:MAG: pentapeptide repeat-containing protein [Desulfobulbaceae bacterium]|nr:pentapeptide repeat-containing protein [Desulfobulbaceae bacterium]
MNSKHIFSLLLVLLIILPGCSKSLHTKDAIEQGAKQLSYDDILGLVSEKTLHIVSWDKSVEADVTLYGSGKIAAVNTLGHKSDGKWKVDQDNTLCLRYDQWANRDMQCYSVFKMDDGFKMFRADGGLESTFTVAGGEQEQQVISGVGLGQAMPGSSVRSEVIPEPETNRTQVIPDPGTSPSQDDTGARQDSWWKFGLFKGDGEQPQEAMGDYAAPPAPLSREMTHLLDEKECVHCDLTSQNLQKASLKNADLEQADLSGTDLSGAFLKNANLKKASLAGAKLSGADLEGADLSGANLEGANLEGANLEDANLEGASLTKARLVDAVLASAVLKNADLGQANLHWANLSEADLSGASLKGSYLVKTMFYKADLTNADLTDAVIQRTNFDSVQGYTPAANDSGSEKKEEEKKKSLFGLF